MTQTDTLSETTPAAALVDDLARDALCESGCGWVGDPLELGELCSRCAGEGRLDDDGAAQVSEGEG